ncbi:hypothetical protein [Vibrio sp. 10N.261.46.A3]|uniref:hypothetical protein n=1 Tax=Vibrio sp. 10N.261.46.A3 TaxID=3229658 RepID=UPI0035541F76
MSKRFNASSVGIALLLSCSMVVYGKEVDWSILSSWCPEELNDCQVSPMRDEVLLASLVDADYRSLTPTLNQGELSFTALLSVYQSLGEGEEVADLSRYIQFLHTDMAQRTHLYRYAIGEGELGSEPMRAELRHYYKELKYLKSLQVINQKQIRIIEDFSLKGAKDLEVQMEWQAERLNEAVMTISSQLREDIRAEEQTLRYFIYRREQISE